MNTLTAVVAIATLTTGIYSNDVAAKTVSEQIRADIEIQLTELHQDTQRQTKMAMTKSSIDLLAMLTAEQDVAAAIFATKTIRTSNSMAE
ncbi:hypothetical protein [Rheinheimera baltica]|uniref:hypothetical protein n=1 Tax=Rheinheimera baltica TaxID=67576 RepID=UPI00273EF85F|nr:hypothetical protein [Rheinheimera baltica]MDP5144321.1 hypothetical protein [Rheinheimera baltica]MDP5151461.1 hypothetical protein [Rheinheimera baltica]MDP5190028.1 hypothetical protein [Rheinheimera baltica]